MTTNILFSAPAERNKEHILNVLRSELPAAGNVLEIASGTGQHVTRFAAALPELSWQPSDPDPEARASIAARIDSDGLSNVSAPLNLDVLGLWPALQVDAIISANLLHISPVAVLPELMENAGRLLVAGALLHLYGPFKVNGTFTSQSNADFDASLRRRNSDWGIRDLEAVTASAAENGFDAPLVRDMPANNFSLCFRRR